ncbi:uncharacterized protein LOC144510338 [Mustelus asterias]
MTAEVGQTVNLTCHHSYEVDFVASYCWYKQRVGEIPKVIDISPCQADGCKFISKKGNGKRELILEIRNVQANDSGFYYCADKVGYAQLQNGPILLVGDSSTNKTALLVFVPPAELDVNETVPLVCLVTGVSSNQIAVFWNISGFITEGSSDPGRMEGDGTYSIRSHVMVSGVTWKSGADCTCVVELGIPGEYWTKSVSNSKTTEKWKEWCRHTVSVGITALVILILLLILISIWSWKNVRSEDRDIGSHNETGRRQQEGRKERKTGDHRQTEANLKTQSGKQDGPLYASLDLAALEKRSKKKRRK